MALPEDAPAPPATAASRHKSTRGSKRRALTASTTAHGDERRRRAAPAGRRRAHGRRTRRARSARRGGAAPSPARTRPSRTRARLRGCVRAKLSDWRGAEVDFEKYLEYAPPELPPPSKMRAHSREEADLANQRARALTLLGAARGCNRNWSAAVARLTEGAQIEPNATRCALLGRVHACERQWLLAMDRYRDALDLDSTLEQARVGLDQVRIKHEPMPLVTRSDFRPKSRGVDLHAIDATPARWRTRRGAGGGFHTAAHAFGDARFRNPLLSVVAVRLNASAGFASRSAGRRRRGPQRESTEQFGINPRARSPSSGQCRLKIDRIRSEWQTTAAGPSPPSASSPRNRSTRRRARKCGSHRDHHRASHRAASTRSMLPGAAPKSNFKALGRPPHARSKISNTPTAAPNESRPAIGPAPSSRASGSSTSGLSIPSVAINAVWMARVSGEA